MNLEIQRGKLEDSRTIDQGKLKEARQNKEAGDSEIKISCLLCKFKPNCLEAIPYYIAAADAYHTMQIWSEEIYCREKLAYCHRSLKSDWEEGNEYEKIAYIYLNQLQSSEQALKFVQNAHNAYFSKGDYPDSINCLTKIAHVYITDRDEYENAEKCLKIAYNAILQTFHLLGTKEDEPTDFIYRAIDSYTSVLYKNDKVRIGIEACENILKIIQQYETNKSRIVQVYGLLLVGCIINEDFNKFNENASLAKTFCIRNSDIRFIENLQDLYEVIVEGKAENIFRNKMIDLESYPVEITSKLQSMYYDRVKTLKKNVKEPGARNSNNNLNDHSRLSLEKNENKKIDHNNSGDEVVIVYDSQNAGESYI
jgi:hypothetical protein